MNDIRHHEFSEGARPLGLATAAFLVSFFAWSMLGPLGPDLQDEIGLSEVELAVVIAVPVQRLGFRRHVYRGTQLPDEVPEAVEESEDDRA